MAIRVTEQSRLTDHVGFLQGAESQFNKIQQQLSTGRRVNVPSDDPEGTSISMSYRRDMLFEAQMRRNIEGGIAYMNASESALASATDIIHRARELAVQGSNGTNSQSGLDAMAIEVDQLLQQMVQVANTNFGGAYVFAGQKTDQPAYTTAGSPVITAVTYQGDLGQRVRRIARQDTSAVNVTGPQGFGSVFQDLITLRDNLRAGSPNIKQSMASLDKDLDTVLAARADIGARVNAFNDATSRSTSKDTDLQQLRANIEDVDISEAIVALTARQNQLQAALGAIGQSMNISLLNYLR
ncbi:MAG: flagellar hook-associated protein FlgL [Dehalococcoidia bacterium]|nr:flagellar hook-associated protein FlgL [Dehalococcoidia bacterium]